MFSIENTLVNPSGLVVSLSWQYANEDGSVSGKHELTLPEEGAELLPLEEVTESIALGWLVDQLPNTAEQFEANIADQKARRESTELLVSHNLPSGDQ